MEGLLLGQQLYTPRGQRPGEFRVDIRHRYMAMRNEIRDEQIPSCAPDAVRAVHSGYTKENATVVDGLNGRNPSGQCQEAVSN